MIEKRDFEPFYQLLGNRSPEKLLMGEVCTRKKKIKDPAEEEKNCQKENHLGSCGGSTLSCTRISCCCAAGGGRCFTAPCGTRFKEV